MQLNTKQRGILMLCGFVIVGVLAARADDWASVVTTEGSGRLELVSNYWLFSYGKSYIARIPWRIEDGTRIRISYQDDGRPIEIDFAVAGISTKGDLCRIHNKLPSRYSTSSGDTIYARPCRSIRPY